MKAQAVVFNQPRDLSLQALELPELQAGQLEVAVDYSGISTGTERMLWDGSMPAFPGMGYPLVPGYETVGRVVRSAPGASLQEGQTVFVPGANCFSGVRSLFGGAASRLIVTEQKVLPISEQLGHRAVLLALAATAYHAVSGGGQQEPHRPPELIIGHGVMGRLLARLTVAAGCPAPTVWESQPERLAGAQGYPVLHPQNDPRQDYGTIYDVSGDASLLDQLIRRLRPGGEVVLAGFYKQSLQFAYAPAFMREASIRVAAEWKRPDLLAVHELVRQGRLSLDGLVTHVQPSQLATAAYETAFGDVACLKMILDWSASA
ncbi:MAG: chlorophyll synthesis pathway protein BchC [Hylemonella sp.]|uniref:chlorophyll synthesis pathway protein BchC n=1 Tax=Hylemonella sp. TaxID=2066020 RepID=UPI0022C126EB|nr:chlorophyll synthesis pathway protein BchC [Hylemonella sp.]MCZ8253794.1 chlorophyll synthesis pathway protein BchC [Hylemonella sp.]